MERSVGDQDDEEEGVVLVQQGDEPQGERGHVRVPVVVHHPVLQQFVRWKKKKRGKIRFIKGKTS